MTIDISKIRPGDEVTVRGTVHSISDGRLVLEEGADSKEAGAWFYSSRIVSHTPKAPLQPGDRVKSSALAAGVYEVVAAPRVRKDGVTEVALWSEAFGHLVTRVDGLERVK